MLMILNRLESKEGLFPRIVYQTFFNHFTVKAGLRKVNHNYTYRERKSEGSIGTWFPQIFYNAIS